MSDEQRILVLDPGVANTGAVFWLRDRIVKAETWKTESGGSHSLDFDLTLGRIKLIDSMLVNAVSTFEPETVVIESYRDFGGDFKRKASNRWSTPMLIGWIANTLSQFPARVVFQDPALALGATKGYRDRWKTKQRAEIIHGDSALTNDHLRSAGSHLVYYIMGGGRR